MLKERQPIIIIPIIIIIIIIIITEVSSQGK